MSLKIALYYDSLWVMGGAERVVCQLANELGADLITSGLNPQLKKWLNIKGKVIDIGNVLINRVGPLGILLESPYRFSQYNPSEEYDIHIFTGFNSIYAARKGNKNIWFSFTPNRMLYDNHTLKTTTGSFAKRFFFKQYRKLLLNQDQKAVRKMSKIVAQTEGVKKRIEEFYNLDSQVIYSPIITSDYYFQAFGDFFLTVGRLVPEKRITLIAQTFSEMPSKKLVIVGDGGERATIEGIAKKSSNIKYLPNLSDDKLKRLYSECLATIYLPINEDFGLIPLEGMASGKVSIVANEGGCLETVTENITGKIITPDKKSLRKVIEGFDKKWAMKQKNACIAASKQFDIEHCVKEWKKVISTL